MSAIFLDLDGTLTDPKQGITKSFIYALEKLRHPAPDADDLEWIIGPSLLDSFAKFGVPDPQAALDIYRARYTKAGLFDCRVYGGIIDMLCHLQGAGHTMCLATAKPHAYARRITAHFGLAGYLTHEFGPELDGTRNDKGELLAHALAKTGFAPETSVMVGDRHHDIDAARAVGMESIGVAWGYGSDTELVAADKVCQTPQELLATLLTR